MKVSPSPDIILRGWLGSKHQLTDLVASVVKTYSIAWNGCRPHSLSCYWHRPDVLVLADSVVKTCFIAYMSADHTIMALASTRCPTPFFHGIGIDQTSLSLQPLEWWPAPLLNMAADHTLSRYWHWPHVLVVVASVVKTCSIAWHVCRPHYRGTSINQMF